MTKNTIGLACGLLWSSMAFGEQETSPRVPAIPTTSTTSAPPSTSTSSPATTGGWQFSIAPYFWAASLSGKTAQFGFPAVDVSASFDKVFRNLDFGGMVIADARKGPYSLFGDVMYTKISADNATPRGILASSAKLQASTFAATAGGGYSIFENSRGRIDLSAALRLWSVDTDITFKGGLVDSRKHSDGATWVDGLVGLRGNYALTSQLYAVGWGFIGAGGADSDWDVAAGVGYRFTERVEAVAGYRAVGVNYRSGGFIYDMTQRGPMIGLLIRF